MFSAIQTKAMLPIADLLVAAMLIGSLGVATCLGGEGDGLRWDQQRIRDYPTYRWLLKARASGAGMPEVTQWEHVRAQGGDFADPHRQENLRRILEDHPESEYADDAALLLARAKFLYDNDAAGAIRDLYAVVERYPNGTWIAEDRLFLQYAMISNVTRRGEQRDGWHENLVSREQIEQMEGQGKQDWLRTWQLVQEHLTYFEHWEEHPNLTADEARYWIAWIIMEANLQNRYNEAEGVLGQIIEVRREQRRTQMDFQAAQQAEYGDGINQFMHRTERRSHRLLIDLLLKQDMVDAARVAAQDYARLHEGHPSVEVVLERVRR